MRNATNDNEPTWTLLSRVNARVTKRLLTKGPNNEDGPTQEEQRHLPKKAVAAILRVRPSLQQQVGPEAEIQTNCEAGPKHWLKLAEKQDSEGDDNRDGAERSEQDREQHGSDINHRLRSYGAFRNDRTARQ
jgi:hypothetical protein